jgi:hypothetical protein
MSVRVKAEVEGKFQGVGYFAVFVEPRMKLLGNDWVRSTSSETILH